MKQLIGKYLKYLKIEKNASKHTIVSYETDLLQLHAFCLQNQNTFDDEKDVAIDEVTRYTLRLWMGDLANKKLARSSIARKSAAARSFFKYCFKRGYITFNPAQFLIIPKKEKKIPQTISIDDIDTIMNLVDMGSPRGIQERAILELLYGTGIRLSEMVNLNVTDIDFRQNQVKIMGKGAKERIVPMGKKAADYLKLHLNNRNKFYGTTTDENDYKSVFLTKKGKRIYPKAIQRIVKHFFSMASEITQKSPHVLRHSFATHMLDRGADIRVIKEFLGHANLSATQIYTHTSVEHLRKVYEKAHPRAKS